MNKKNRNKAGLGFGVLMMFFYLLEDLLQKDNPTSKDIILSVIFSMVGGAVAAVLFGWLIGLFSNSRFVNKTTVIETEPGENILFFTPASHKKGIEAVGGKLYLTNRRLVFRSHKLNIQNHQLSINLADIEDTGRYKTLGLINNGLWVLANNKTERFVVEQAEEWLKQFGAGKMAAQ